MLVGALVATASGRACALEVAASIGPVASLADGVLGSAGSAMLLIPSGQSPHTFALRPSTAHAIAHADVVFRISTNYELALNAPLGARDVAPKVVTLIDAPGVTVYPARDLDEIATAQSGPENAALPALVKDPHIWLDPDNARAMTAEMARALAKADSAHGALYRANATLVDQWLAALDTAMKADLEPVRSRPFIVFHDGYQYLERHYGLTFAGAVTEIPGRSPGAAHIHKVRSEIRDARVPCVFSEPQFEPRLVKTITEGLPVRTGVLDMLGADEAQGPHLYFDMMRGLSHALVECLAPA